ncbi:uncharacterized protein [Magallana gigas]|uniref:uncharacterized protein isoform X2 n=1 Tax=Magallana gigas TaxID=29159 RepID=UPI00334043B6
MDLLILTFFGWIYQTTADSELCVSIDASTNFIKTGEAFSIDCNIFELSGVDLLTLNVEILLRQNQFIKRIVKGSISNFENNDLPENDNYSWMVFYYKDDDYHKRTIVRLHVSNASNLDEGLYLCYATLSNKKITKYNSKSLYTSNSSRAGNLTEYVTMPKPNASSPTLTPFDCSVFEDDSIVHQIRLRPNESAFYSVLPTFSVNNKSIVISKPWVSYKGCYNYTVNKFKEEDCTTIDVTEWTKTIDRLPLIGVTRLNKCILLDQSENATGKRVSYEYCREDKKDSYEYIELYSIIDGSYSLSFIGEESSTCNAAYIDIEENKFWGIPCSETARCDAFCLRHDGSNVTEHGNKQWKKAMDLCISLNKSLPGIESDLLKSPLSHIVNNSLICLAVYQNLSIMFRPVIKQIKNIDGNTTVQPTNNTRGLPFLCRVKTDYEKPVPCINTSQTDSNVFTPTIGQNTGVPPTRQSDSKLIIIIAPSSVGFLLIVVVVSCVIHRVKRNRKNQGIRNTGLMSKEHIYSQPVNTQEAVIENIQRDSINNIEQLEEDYSKLHSADKIKFNNTLEDEYAMTEQSSEYDVLRNTRENQEVSVDANIYDRTNNSVSGIYDTTLQTPDNDTYNL